MKPSEEDIASSKFRDMNITFDELRDIKHRLPHGSIARIAKELNLDEQTVRNYFGAHKYGDENEIADAHIQPGPHGGIVNLEDTRILDLAMEILKAEEGKRHSINLS